MAFIDKKTRVVDMQLTARGRELLATNQLNIVAYAFSDEMIDYSGSLSQSLATGTPMDTVVYRNFIPMQADQMDQTGLYRDLSSFLYTAPEQRDVLPAMKVSQTQLSMSRTYKELQYQDFVNGALNTGTGAVVAQFKTDGTVNADRQKQYVAQQNLARLEMELPQILKVLKR